MGNRKSRNIEYLENWTNKMSKFTSVDDFKFHDPWNEEDSNNGLFFDNIFMPDEILMQILSLIPPTQLLPLTLVCKKWCNIIKSDIFWMEIHNKSLKAKMLPWYVYYLYYTTDAFKNLLKNGNGEDQFNHWIITRNYGDEFRIEDPPCGSDPLPEGIPDFNGHTSCFATSFSECTKIQEFKLESKRLLRYVMNNHKPHIYVSEWVAGRFDCGSKYKLVFRGFGREYEPKKENSHMDYDDDDDVDDYNNALFEHQELATFAQWTGKEWKKREILVKDYPKNVMTLVFEHEGCDTQFWKGHYGSKMAGGVVKLLLDSIQLKENMDQLASE